MGCMDAAFGDFLGKIRGGEASGDVFLQVVPVPGVIGCDALRPETGESLEDGALVACRGHDPHPCGKSLETAGEDLDDIRVSLVEESLVQSVDEDVADPLLGCGQGMQWTEYPLGEGSTGVVLATLFGKCVPDSRDIELLGVGRQLARDHGGQSLNEAGRLEALGFVRLTAVTGDNLPAGIHMSQLGDECRFPGARIPGDQEGPLVGLEAPEVNLLEEPLSASEVAALGGEVVGEVERLEPVLPEPVAHLAPQGLVDPLNQSLESYLIGILGVLPTHHMDVVESVDDEGGLAWLHHRRDNRSGRRPGAGIAELIQTNAVDEITSGRPPHGVRAQQADHDLGGSQPVLDLVLPLRGGADLVLIAPDIKPGILKILLQTDGDLRGILAPIAQKNLRLLGWRRWGIGNGGWGCRIRGGAVEALLAGTALPLRGFGFPGGVARGAVGAGGAHGSRFENRSRLWLKFEGQGRVHTHPFRAGNGDISLSSITKERRYVGNSSTLQVLKPGEDLQPLK